MSGGTSRRVGLSGIRPASAARPHLPPDLDDRLHPVVRAQPQGEDDAPEAADPATAALREAQSHAQDLRRRLIELEQDSSRMREEAYQQGLRDGTLAGEARSQALALAQTERLIAELREAVESRLEAVEGSLEGFFLHWETGLLGLAMAMARRVVGENCSEPGTVATLALRRALRQLGSEARIVIQAHPADLDAVGRVGARWSEEGSGRRVEIRSASHLFPGSIVVETDSGAVEADVRRMLGRMETLLAEAMAEEERRLVAGG